MGLPTWKLKNKKFERENIKANFIFPSSPGKNRKTKSPHTQIDTTYRYRERKCFLERERGWRWGIMMMAEG
ncbi:hypothetical protein L2E82_09990 [Cichorium intybus]|uniref:Uncharacterized protein n=1 Tax=Cichorium intybus TaxID=13427 RepID=A0ACB9G9F7_CICIN|nr:hypothetical protein L2E82_09990 [Cichorium intybus]